MSNLKTQTKDYRIYKDNLSFTPDIGLCVEIANSKKIFQIVGLNDKQSICWIRELPLNGKTQRTFELSIHQIMKATICPISKKNENYH